MSKIIYKAKYIYTDEKFVTGHAILVEDSVIKRIEKADLLVRAYPDARVSDWGEVVIVPGTVNAHNHCFQSLLRGIACDRPFLEWRDNALYKFSPRLTKEHIYNGAVFAFSEMMKCGVTTVSDFFYLHNYGIESDEMIIKAANDVGIRLVLARTIGKSINGGFGMVLDGSERVDTILSMAMTWDTMGGVARRSWARNENSVSTCIEYNEMRKGTDHITIPYIASEELVNRVISENKEKYK